jgi:hypothetical protein
MLCRCSRFAASTHTPTRATCPVLLQELEALTKVTRLLESTINSSINSSSNSSSSSSTAVSKSAREDALRELRACHTAVEAMLRDENVEGEDRATATALRSRYAAILVRLSAVLYLLYTSVFLTCTCARQLRCCYVQ